MIFFIIKQILKASLTSHFLKICIFEKENMFTSLNQINKTDDFPTIKKGTDYKN